MNQASVAPPELCERPASSDVPKSEPAVALHERRRLGERAPVQLDATVFRGAELRLTHTLDLSSTGCALRACADPLTGSVTLQLVSTGGELLRLQARFKRSFQGQMPTSSWIWTRSCARRGSTSSPRCHSCKQPMTERAISMLCDRAVI